MNKNIKHLIIIIGGLIIISLITTVFLTYIGSLLGTSWGGTVAVIPIQGEIGYSSSNILGGTTVNPDTIKTLINDAENDANVKAILLEINSGGGSPVASEEIMEAVKECKKPVVVWISDVGASGAYLVASPADKIIASQSSIVGSIGVILSLTNLSDLYQKLGINRTAITGGEYKDMGADYRDLTPEERKMLQEMVDEDYDYFIALVAENRNLTKKYVESIAEGKIYTGPQAKKVKLIDDVGSKDYALDEAAKLGGIIGPYDIVTLTPPVTFEEMIAGFSSNFGYSIGKGMGEFMQKGTIEYVFH
ncbi:MAG: signal peptide peptidase SppA [Methanobacteriaceae archaeon]